MSRFRLQACDPPPAVPPREGAAVDAEESCAEESGVVVSANTECDSGRTAPGDQSRNSSAERFRVPGEVLTGPWTRALVTSVSLQHLQGEDPSGVEPEAAGSTRTAPTAPRRSTGDVVQRRRDVEEPSSGTAS